MKNANKLLIEYSYLRELLEEAKMLVESALNLVENSDSAFLNESFELKRQLELNLFYLDSFRFNLKILLSMVDEVEVLNKEVSLCSERNNILTFEQKDKEIVKWVEDNENISYIFTPKE